MPSKKHIVKATISLDVPFWPYGSKKKNQLAISQIKRQIRANFIDEYGLYFPLEEEKDPNDYYSYKDSTHKAKVKVTFKCPKL